MEKKKVKVFKLKGGEYGTISFSGVEYVLMEPPHVVTMVDGFVYYKAIAYEKGNKDRKVAIRWDLPEGFQGYRYKELIDKWGWSLTSKMGDISMDWNNVSSIDTLKIVSK